MYKDLKNFVTITYKQFKNNLKIDFTLKKKFEIIF